MTYKELKEIQVEICTLRSEIAKIRSGAESTTQTLSDMPAGGGISDKVGDAVVKIKVISDRIGALNRKLSSALDDLPKSLEAHCIVLKIKRRYSWVKIAQIIGGNNTADGVRMKVYRYRW